MEPRKKVIDFKFDMLYESLHEKGIFSVADAISVWDDKSSTTYWNLAKLTDEGKIKRIQKGTYAFLSTETKHMPMPTESAERIQYKLNESGYSFYVSGLDVLLRFMQHIPDQYPVIVFVEQSAIDEIAYTLQRIGMTVMTGNEYLTAQSFIERNEMTDLVLLYSTRNFTYAVDGYATNEKAFVDLYFEVTRRSYSLPLQELARVFTSMMEQGALQRGKLLQAAHERSIRSELALIYDINQMNPLAIQLAELVREGNK